MIFCLGYDRRTKKFILEDDERQLRLNAHELVLRFTARHANDIRFVAKRNHWMTFDGTGWSEDSTLRVFDLARKFCREVSEQVLAQGRPGLARQLASADTIAAVEQLARLAAATDPTLFDRTSHD